MNQNDYERMQSLRASIEQQQKELEKLEEKQVFDPNGIWEFTTEDDAEGRSMKQLGTYEGNLFDGLEMYAKSAYYKLYATKTGYLTTQTKPKGGSVAFSVYDKTIKVHDKKDQLSRLSNFVPENGYLKDSNYYGAIEYVWNAKKS